MGQRTNILLQIEGRSGSRLNRVYHLQWGYYKYMPMAFLHLLSGQYFRQSAMDIYESFTTMLDLDGILTIERDWNSYDFNKLAECQNVLLHRDNNNGAMVVIVKEGVRALCLPTYKLGFLLGPKVAGNELPYARWVSIHEFLQHQSRYDKERDDAFAQAFETVTTLSGTQYFSQQLL